MTMRPDLIVSLPTEVPLPQYRLFQSVRFNTRELNPEQEELAIGLVVGWVFITRRAIGNKPEKGPIPHWQYAIQFDPVYQFSSEGEPYLVDEALIIGIAETL